MFNIAALLFLFLKRMAFPLYCLHFVMLRWFTHRFPEFGKEAVCENKNRKKENYKRFYIYIYIHGGEIFQGQKAESIRLCT